MRKAIMLAGVIWCVALHAIAQDAANVKPLPYPDFNACGEVIKITRQQAIRLINSNTIKPHVRYEILINAKVGTLPALTEDRSFLKPVFSKAKWEMMDWGSGNFDGGPRFTDMQFYKAGRYCAVFRKYTSTTKKKDGDYYMRVTEEFEMIGN